MEVQTPALIINGNKATLKLYSGVSEFTYDKRAKESIELLQDRLICHAKTAAKVTVEGEEPSIQKVDYRYAHGRGIFDSIKLERTVVGDYMVYSSDGSASFNFENREDAEQFQRWLEDWAFGEV